MEILFIEKKGFSELGENCNFKTVFSFCAIYSTAPHQYPGAISRALVLPHAKTATMLVLRFSN